MKKKGAARAARVLATLALAACAAVPPYIRARPAQAATQTVQLTWIRVDTLRPDTLYAGGYLQRDYRCPPFCPEWSARSVDAGRSWRRMGVVPDIAGYPRSFIYPASTGYAYASLTTDGSPSGSGNAILRSRDRGLNWEGMIYSSGNIGSAYDNLAVSPGAEATVYAITLPDSGEGGYDPRLRVTNDAGAHWRTAPGTLNLYPAEPSGDIELLAGSVLADARHRDTVYTGLTPLRVSASWPSLWTRTEDAGRTWHLVADPPGSQVSSGIRGSPDPVPVGFTLYTDAHLPSLLVARVPAAPAPARHRYVSADAGRTWRSLTCPGALRGTCPLAAVDNAFGSGRSYGIYADGIHAFRGACLAGARLPGINDRLPAAPGSIVGLQGGTRAGDPVYVLARGGGRLQLFRSADEGQIWHRVTPQDSLVPDTRS